LRTISSGGQQHSLEWTDVTLSIGDKEILNSVSGHVSQGEMACILGPSGSGKSTLLNILAGRMNTQRVGMRYSGQISLSGCDVDPVKVRSHIAYVMQEDALPGLMTPRELMRMSAALRLGKAGPADRQGEGLLKDLRLEKCADTYVGSQLIKGLSGGEKKRTAVAVELITKPKMIFLDEPLSGLDSFAAWTVVQVLKQLAHHGCSVLCTIHQPSSEIFQTFEKMICLTEGRVCYCGAVSELSSYMARAGHPVPLQYNPADHILFFVQARSVQDRATFVDNWAREEKQAVLPGIWQRRASASRFQMPRRARSRPCHVQLCCLILREFRVTVRDKVSLIMRFAVNGIMGILFACIFQGVGGKDGEVGGMQSHFGAVCNIMIGTMFGSAQPLLLLFPFERPIFLREYAANMYGSIPYFVAKVAIEIPLSFLTSLETWLIAYWVMDLKGSFLALVLASWGLSLAGASTALLIGCNIGNAKTVQEVATLMFVPQILFSGIFISINLIPSWLRWLQYVCALKYAINLGMLAEFENLPGGEAILASQDIHKDKALFYVAVLIGIFCVFRLLAMIGLRQKAKFVF